MQNKNNRITKLIARLKTPAHLFTDKNDVFYLTGVELDGFWLLVTKKGPAAFAPRMLAGQVKKALTGAEVISGDSLVELVSEYIKRKGISRLGLNGSKVSYALFGKLNRKISVKDEGDILSGQRQRKDVRELACIRKSCKIASSALKFTRKFIRPGTSEIEISFIIEEYFAKHGVRPAFPLIVASGPNSANPHHVSSSRKIKRNDVILIDIGCMFKGYCSDLTRTFFLGKTISLQKKVYSLVKRAQISALKKVRSGAPAGAIDKAARDVIREAGFGERFIHTTGHGVGIDIHEAPRLSAKDKTVLTAGMVITVEPGIYLEGSFGVRIEDTALVTKKGREVFTR